MACTLASSTDSTCRMLPGRCTKSVLSPIVWRVTPEVETIEPLEQKMIAKASRRVGYRNRSMLNSSFTLTREAIRHPS